MTLRTKLVAVALLLFGCFMLVQYWRKYGLLIDSAERWGGILAAMLSITGGVGILLGKRWGWHIAHGLLGLWAIGTLMIGIPICLYCHYLHYIRNESSPLLLIAACFTVLAALCIAGIVLLRSDKPAGWSRRETLEER